MLCYSYGSNSAAKILGSADMEVLPVRHAHAHGQLAVIRFSYREVRTSGRLLLVVRSPSPPIISCN